MLIKFFSIFWILTGLYILVNPQALLQKIRKKGIKSFKKLFFGAGIFLSASLISFGLKESGFLPKIILLLGTILIFKSCFILKSKFSEAILNWTLKLPVYVFRLAGLIYIIIGLILLFYSGQKT